MDGSKVVIVKMNRSPIEAQKVSNVVLRIFHFSGNADTTLAKLQDSIRRQM